MNGVLRLYCMRYILAQAAMSFRLNPDATPFIPTWTTLTSSRVAAATTSFASYHTRKVAGQTQTSDVARPVHNDDQPAKKSEEQTPRSVCLESVEKVSAEEAFALS